MKGRTYDSMMRPLEHRSFSPRRDELLSRARGKVLEIGFGTGASLAHYPPGVEITGLDYDPEMLDAARAKPETAGVRLVEGDAQELPFGDGEFDTAVANFVLCSVPEPVRAVREVFRVLKPGGQFLLLEHVRRDTPVVGKLLDWGTVPWTHFTGCHLNRNPEPLLREAGFAIESAKPLWRGFGKMWVARKTG